MKTLLPVACIIALLLSACGKDSGGGGAGAPSAAAPTAAPLTSASGPMEADLQRTLKEQSKFYVFKTAADFGTDTAGLTWKDGSDLPEFADPNAKRGGTLKLWLADFPRMFRTNGPDANDVFREYLLDYNELTFLGQDPNAPGRHYPQLAEAWAIDAPHRTVYFKLDPAARWSDGVPVTTDDVVFSWYFYRSPNLNEPWYNDFYTKFYEKLTVYGPHEFALTLPELKPDIEDRAGNISIYPKHFFGDFGPHWEERYNWKVIPTTGAYTLRPEDVKQQVSLTLTRVPNWWASDKRFMRHRFNPDRIHLTVIRDPDKAFEAFTRGDIDAFGLPSPNLWYDKLPDSFPEVANGYIIKAKFFNQIPAPDVGLWLNESKPPLDDLNVRLGVQYATNMGLVCKQYYRGDAVLQQTRDDGWGWNINPSVGPRPYDPEKAREYFAKAGYTQQGPDGILTNAQGQRLSLAITCYARRWQDILVILKHEALKAGLEFNIDLLDETTGWKKMQEKHHDIALAALQRTVEMYPRYWETHAGDNAYDVPYLPDGSPNPARKVKQYTNNMQEIANPELDRLIKAYDKAETMDQVKDLAAKMEKIMYDDASWVNGWKLPFYRLGYWRWVHWPQDFNAMQSLDWEQYWLMWVDPAEEKATREAKDAGKTFPPQVLTFSKFKDQ